MHQMTDVPSIQYYFYFFILFRLHSFFLFLQREYRQKHENAQYRSNQSSNRSATFYASLSLEFMARVLGCLEVYFNLNILTTDVRFPACILIMAFTSLFANLFFFSPMQLGAREGGFALAPSDDSLSGYKSSCPAYSGNQ